MADRLGDVARDRALGRHEGAGRHHGFVGNRRTRSRRADDRQSDNGSTDVSIRWPDSPLEQERRLFDIRLPAADRLWSRQLRLNRVISDPGIGRRRLVIMAVGKSRLDVTQALAMLGIASDELENLGLGFAQSACRGRSIRSSCAIAAPGPTRSW